MLYWRKFRSSELTRKAMARFNGLIEMLTPYKTRILQFGYKNLFGVNCEIGIVYGGSTALAARHGLPRKWPKLAMPIPYGTYRYEIWRAGALAAVEEAVVAPGQLRGERRSSTGANLHAVEATLAADGAIMRIGLRYQRGMFKRDAVYEAVDDTLRGSVSAMAGRNEVIVKLGRFRELDADLVVCRALIIARTRARGQRRFTGRVTVIDPNTLVAASYKQTYSQIDDVGMRWRREARMGESETIELDADGRIARIRDEWGCEVRLAEFAPAKPK